MYSLKKNIVLALAVLPAAILLQSLSQLQKTKRDCASSSMKSSGPPSCYAGEPPLNLNCSAAGCHDDAIPNTGAAQVFFDLGGADNGYIPGQKYDFHISVVKPGMMRSGFQFIALQDNDITISPGTITLLNPSRTQVIDVNNPHPGPCGNQSTKVWIEHTFNGINNTSADTNKWTFRWQAPNTDVGSITFYLAALEANNSLDEEGDEVYTLNKTIGNVSSVQNMNTAPSNIKVYPNPSSGKFFIHEGSDTEKEICVFDVQGKQIGQFHSSDKTIFLDLSENAKGVFFLKIKHHGFHFYEKVIIY